MPFERQGPRALSAVVNVRLTPEEKARLQADAHVAGLTVSRLARRRLFGRRVVASVDGTMIRELRRLGGLLKHVSNSTGGIYSPEVARAMKAVTAYIKRLSEAEARRGRQP